MNTDGCPSGLATDEVFRLDFSEPCSTTLQVVDAVLWSLLSLRFITLLMAWWSWITKTRRLASVARAGGKFSDRKKWEHRVPVISLVSTVAVVIWIAFFLLVRFNLASARNGVALLFWVLAFDAFAVYSLISQRSIIRLGKRLLPLFRAKLRLEAEEAAASSPAAKDVLQTFDRNLKIILFVQIIAIISQSMCGIILSVVYPGSFVVFEAVCALEGMYFFLLCFAMVYQLNRVGHCVRTSTIDETTKGSVLGKLRAQQSHFFLTGSIAFTINILMAVGVIPAVWYLLMYWILIETSVCSTALIEMLWSLFCCACLKSRKLNGNNNNRTHANRKTQSSSTTKNTVPVDAQPHVSTDLAMVTAEHSAQ